MSSKKRKVDQVYSEFHSFSKAWSPQLDLMLVNETEMRNRRQACRCKHSRCLKMYCECFSLGIHCEEGVCDCIQCANNVANEKARSVAVLTELEQNPFAFRTEPSQDRAEHKGCKCKRSFCLKKYCDCFQAKIVCTEQCKCNDCKNYTNSPELENLKVSHATRLLTRLNTAKCVKDHNAFALNRRTQPAYTLEPFGTPRVTISPYMNQATPGDHKDKTSKEFARDACGAMLWARDRVEGSFPQTMLPALTGVLTEQQVEAILEQFDQQITLLMTRVLDRSDTPELAPNNREGDKKEMPAEILQPDHKTSPSPVADQTINTCTNPIVKE
mmetsp:Transcript_2253/g.4296  ORF Transcript_2253/g.4296 Transcript_2253/m.4296 type:complete len:328 (+) Transcript_2253:131-1114(+)